MTRSIAARSAAPAATRSTESTCAPVTRPRPKKRPSRASGAAWCRIDPQPDCESKPLTASRAPRKSASAAARVVRPHHHRAAVPARRTARQPVVRARRPPRPVRRASRTSGSPQVWPSTSRGCVQPAISGRSRDSASGAGDAPRPQPVADRRPEPVGGAARLRPVVHRQGGDASRSRARRGPDRVRHRVLAAEAGSGGTPRRTTGRRSRRSAAATRRAAARTRRKPVPGQPRVGVVHRVVVVVEEQQRQRPAVLDDRRCAPPPARAPDARGRCGSAGSPARASRRRDRRRASTLPASQSHSATGTTPSPCSAQARATAPVAGADQREVAAHEVGHADERPDQHPPEQRVVDGEHRPRRPRQPRPDRRVEIVRLGIVVRIGQRRVVVVREVQVAEPLVGDDEPERRERPARRSATGHGVGWPWIASCCSDECCASSSPSSGTASHGPSAAAKAVVSIQPP